jgi:hypothetical protein
MTPAKPARVCSRRCTEWRIMIEQCADCRAETATNTAVSAVDRQESDNLDDRDNHRIQQN